MATFQLLARHFNVTFIDKSSRDKVCLKGEFDDAEWSRLLSFAECADELKRLRAVQEGLNVKYSIHWNEQTGLHHKCLLPPDDVIAALLHRLRPFVLQDEPTYFFRVCKIITKRLNHHKFRAAIKHIQDLFSGKDFQSLIVIRSNEVVLNSDAALMKWLNAFEYHRDTKKREELESLHWLLPLESSRALFVSMMIDKAKAALKVAEIIRAFEKRQGTTVSVRV